MILRIWLISVFACAWVFPAFCQHIPDIATDSSSFLKNELPYTTLRSISISGNRHTKDYIVKREIALKAGTVYNGDGLDKAIRLTREQLMNTTLFVDVSVDTVGIGNNEVDIKVLVKERWYLFPAPYFRIVDRNWNIWLKDYGGSLDRANIGIKIKHENFSGRNDKFNLWLIGGYTQQFSFNYTRPYFDKKLRFGYNVGMIYARNREVNPFTDFNKQQFVRGSGFIRRYIRADVGLSYRMGSKLRMQVHATYNYEGLGDTVIKLNLNYLGEGKTKASFFDVSYNVQYYNVDYIPYPLRGWYIDGFFTNRIGGKGSMNMQQLGMKFFATRKLAKNTWLDFQAIGAIRLPKAQPYYNSRLMGYGDMYMQGLEYYVTDGTAGGMMRGNLRTQILKFAIKDIFRMKRPESRNIVRKTFNGLSKTHNYIPFRIFLKAFGNLGYVYNQTPGNSFMNNRLLRSGGLGIDVVTVYDWVLKMELSFNQFDKGGIGNLGNKLFVHTQSDF